MVHFSRSISATAAAVKAFGEKGLIDLIATMGYYDTVAMTLITAKAVAPKEEDVPQLAALPRVF